MGLSLPRKPVSKVPESPASEVNPEGGSIPQVNPYPSAAGFVEGVPYFNDRLPWLSDKAVCGLHQRVFRDKVTGYGYCHDCGFSFGLV